VKRDVVFSSRVNFFQFLFKSVAKTLIGAWLFYFLAYETWCRSALSGWDPREKMNVWRGLQVGKSWDLDPLRQRNNFIF